MDVFEAEHYEMTPDHFITKEDYLASNTSGPSLIMLSSIEFLETSLLFVLDNTFRFGSGLLTILQIIILFNLRVGRRKHPKLHTVHQLEL